MDGVPKVDSMRQSEHVIKPERVCPLEPFCAHRRSILCDWNHNVAAVATSCFQNTAANLCSN